MKWLTPKTVELMDDTADMQNMGKHSNVIENNYKNVMKNWGGVDWDFVNEVFGEDIYTYRKLVMDFSKRYKDGLFNV